MAQNVLTRNGNGNNSTRNDAPKSNANTPTAVVPFIRASDEHLEPANVDVQRLILSTSQDLGTFDLPAYGYLAHLYILVEFSGGAGTGAVLTEDGPYNSLQNIALTEPNGSPHVQFTSGWQMMLAQKYGGYLPPSASDPRRSPIVSTVTAAGNLTFVLRLPVSVGGRDGVGSQANQDSAGQFKFRATLAPSATIFATPPSTTLPTARVRAWMQAWDQPEPTSGGVANQVEPPAAGTTSFWTVQSGVAVSSGDNTIPLTRKGNFLRQIIFVLRTSGSRATGQTNWPSETRIMRDAFPIRYYNDLIWRHQMFERTGYTGTADTANGPENGVRFHDYMHEFDGSLGRENRDLWQPTLGSTRIEIVGSFGAASTLDIITNDVAVAQNVFV